MNFSGMKKRINALSRRISVTGAPSHWSADWSATCLLGAVLLVSAGASPAPAWAQRASSQSATVMAVYGRGVHAYFSGDSSLAEQYFTQVIEAGSTDPRPYYFRAMVRLSGGKQFEAENDMRVGASYEAAESGHATFDWSMLCRGFRDRAGERWSNFGVRLVSICFSKASSKHDNGMNNSIVAAQQCYVAKPPCLWGNRSEPPQAIQPPQRQVVPDTSTLGPLAAPPQLQPPTLSTPPRLSRLRSLRWALLRGSRLRWDLRLGSLIQPRLLRRRFHQTRVREFAD